MSSINRQIGVGVAWNMLNLFVSRGASTIFVLFLTRFLAPDAFGLIAMATVVFELAGAFVTSGLGAALIRSNTISDTDLNTVFYTNLGLSLVAYSLLYAGAPFIADFYAQPKLTLVVRVMGLVVFINASKVVQVAILSRAMDFESMMKANSIGVICSGALAVTAAWYGCGVWSIVLQMLSASLISTTLLWISSSWKPKFKYSTQSFNKLFGFGKNLLAEGLINVLFQNSYILMIGRFFSAEATGLYFLAKKISELISHQLTNSVQSVTYPALSSLQNNNMKLVQKYRQIMQLMMFIIAPTMGLLAALTPQIFKLLFEQKWEDAGVYLQLLCIVGALYPLHALNINLLNVIGRSDLVFKIGLIKRSIYLILLILSIPFGIIGIIIGQVLGAFLALIPNTYFTSKLVGYSLWEQTKDAIKPMLAALVSSVGVWLFSNNISITMHFIIALEAFVGLTFFLFISFLIRTEGLLLIWKKVQQRNSKVKF